MITLDDTPPLSYSLRMTSSNLPSLRIAHPVYPVTSPTGNVLAAGTTSTKVVRVESPDYIADINHADLINGEFQVKDVRFWANAFGVEPKQFLSYVLGFARVN